MPPLHRPNPNFRPDLPPCRFAWPPFCPGRLGSFCTWGAGPCVLFKVFSMSCLPPTAAVRHGYFPILDISSSRVPAPVSNRLLFPVVFSPWAVLARIPSQNKTSFFLVAALCTCRFHSPRCALTPLEWAYCPYPIPVFITCMPPITGVA
jgi:hypothetical protein